MYVIQLDDNDEVPPRTDPLHNVIFPVEDEHPGQQLPEQKNKKLKYPLINLYVFFLFMR